MYHLPTATPSNTSLWNAAHSPSYLPLLNGLFNRDPAQSTGKYGTNSCCQLASRTRPYFNNPLDRGSPPYQDNNGLPSTTTHMTTSSPSLTTYKKYTSNTLSHVATGLATNQRNCSPARPTLGLIPLDIVHVHNNIIKVSIPTQLSITTPTTNAPSSWSQYVSNLPQWERDLLSSVHRASRHTPFHTRLRAANTNIYIVSDGSFINGSGTFGWVIASSDEILFTNSGHIASKSASPFRSECFGILSWLVFIQHYMIYFKVSHAQCTMRPFCDNTSTLPYMSTEPLPWKLAKPLCPHYDATHEIRCIFRSLHLICPNLQPGCHVKGHQDSSPDRTYPETLNIMADSIARSAQLRHNNASPLHLPHCSALLQVRGTNTFCDETESARWVWRNIELQRYYMDRFLLTPQQLKDISWLAVSKSLLMLPPPLQAFSTKLIIGWLSTGTRLLKYGNSVTLCHCCNKTETANHLFQCQGRADANIQLIADLDIFLRSINTEPPIILALTHHLQQWLLPHCSFDPIQFPLVITKCIENQTTLGWHLAARGIFSSSHHMD
jgi:hypothetical protein